MLTLDKPNVILWEAESVIETVVVKRSDFEQQVEEFMQDEPFYGDPDYSYY